MLRPGQGGQWAGLQRSAQTFRRSGSSGLVWDERFLTEDGGGGARRTGRRQPELRHSRSGGSVLQRGEEGAGHEHDDKKRKLVLARPKHKDQRKNQQQQEVEVVPAGRTAFPMRDVAPAAEPPSPRLPSGCCAPCAIFRGSGAGAASSLARRAKPRRR